ncbi:S-adenosyl-L-methionine-dependent methyltransferase [Gamsiella multidivaricata]|uniref:S-adenosyl-L-methionine-dependent methyltransferase n=1 Tax=Gamsiella multidivaricata TaxID=101098 RepID=UPI0022208A8C|nr:S-adenosyl-L-methionine-dependent methyltransferase [Gamsiella multidivaricata]KAI7816676.1 S-adenosyl-L-methionine-dependent methyltransferase [Gamsiella multidivaricata]
MVDKGITPSHRRARAMNFYKQAAQILDRLGKKEGSIKGLTLGNAEVTDKKRMYALICETLKHNTTLSLVLQESKLLTLEKKLTRSLALLLLHDLLFQNRGIQASDAWPMKQAVMKHKARLKAEFVKAKIKVGAKKDGLIEGEEEILMPRYVRVNLLMMTPQQVIDAFIADNWAFLPAPPSPFAPPPPNTFHRDEHLDFMLVFPPKSDLHLHPLYVSGVLILQDKASCFPAAILSPPKNAYVIDGCAAPGNKTSQLAMGMGNGGKIIACDLDLRRLNILKRLTTKAGCTNITALNTSFLTLDTSTEDHSKVTHILLDPSCSGSGIVNRMDHLVDAYAEEQEQASILESTTTGGAAERAVAEEKKKERLKSLGEFQIECVTKAMTFPNVRRISYSTCSIYAEENEHVVTTLLRNHWPQWKLSPRSKVLPTWHRRGYPADVGDIPGLVETDEDRAKVADCLVRAVPGGPDGDLMNGFFVACFERVSKNDNPGLSPTWKGPSIGVKRAHDDITSNGAAAATVSTASANKKKKNKKKKQKASTADGGATETVTDSSAGPSEKKAMEDEDEASDGE